MVKGLRVFAKGQFPKIEYAKTNKAIFNLSKMDAKKELKVLLCVHNKIQRK